MNLRSLSELSKNAGIQELEKLEEVDSKDN
jgi:hypothetical protein